MPDLQDTFQALLLLSLPVTLFVTCILSVVFYCLRRRHIQQVRRRQSQRHYRWQRAADPEGYSHYRTFDRAGAVSPGYYLPGDETRGRIRRPRGRARRPVTITTGATTPNSGSEDASIRRATVVHVEDSRDDPYSREEERIYHAEGEGRRRLSRSLPSGRSIHTHEATSTAAAILRWIQEQDALSSSYSRSRDDEEDEGDEEE